MNGDYQERLFGLVWVSSLVAACSGSSTPSKAPETLGPDATTAGEHMGEPDSGLRVIMTRWVDGSPTLTFGYIFLDLAGGEGKADAYLVDPERRLVHFRLVETVPKQRFERIGVIALDDVKERSKRNFVARLLEGPLPTRREYDEQVNGWMAGKPPEGAIQAPLPP